MFELDSILAAGCTQANVPTTSRKRTLDFASELISKHHAQASHRHLYQALLERERLGSTGVGDSVAIPHCRLGGISTITGALIVLNEPIDYDAPDGEQVDIFFVLVVPEEEQATHLEVLAALARTFSDAGNRSLLRAQQNDKSLYDCFLELIK